MKRKPETYIKAFDKEIAKAYFRGKENEFRREFLSDSPTETKIREN